MADIFFAKGDDWRGIYLDGRLAFEGHSYPIKELVTILNQISTVFADEGEVDLDWLDNRGGLPENLDEVRFW